MPRMIRSKREWRCSNCGAKFIKWAGICNNCSLAGTLQEFLLVPVKKTTTATPSQRAIHRRAKKSERDEARRMTEIDGPDPMFKNIASSTGRVGHITGMRIDGVSRSYVMENKNRTLPSWLLKAWVLINQRAEDFSKNALLHLDPPNMPKEYPINGLVRRLDTMAVITQSRHESLITTERENAQIREVLLSDLHDSRKLTKIRELLGVL